MLIFILLSAVFILSSCSTHSPEIIVQYSFPEDQQTEIVLKEPHIKPSYNIMSRGMRTNEELADFLFENNPDLEYQYALKLAKIYITEAKKEGVNYDIAFSQMCLETGYQKYTGVVSPDQNNFCGLGATSSDNPGEEFKSVRFGIRAHIQHLKAYASTEELKHKVIDGRFKYVQRGVAPTVFDLTGRWAADPEYGDKIKSLLLKLYQCPGI
jgi:hypothetical protein